VLAFLAPVTRLYNLIRRLSMEPVLCTVCEAELLLEDGIEEGEIIVCPDCGTEFEVVSLDPVEIEEAPEVEEDWGE
jgi:alpha-aminoadipate carrier protein LysW